MVNMLSIKEINNSNTSKSNQTITFYINNIPNYSKSLSVFFYWQKLKECTHLIKDISISYQTTLPLISWSKMNTNWSTLIKRKHVFYYIYFSPFLFGTPYLVLTGRFHILIFNSLFKVLFQFSFTVLVYYRSYSFI